MNKEITIKIFSQNEQIANLKLDNLFLDVEKLLTKYDSLKVEVSVAKIILMQLNLTKENFIQVTTDTDVLGILNRLKSPSIFNIIFNFYYLKEANVDYYCINKELTLCYWQDAVFDCLKVQLPKNSILSVTQNRLIFDVTKYQTTLKYALNKYEELYKKLLAKINNSDYEIFINEWFLGLSELQVLVHNDGFFRVMTFTKLFNNSCNHQELVATALKNKAISIALITLDFNQSDKHFLNWAKENLDIDWLKCAITFKHEPKALKLLYQELEVNNAHRWVLNTNYFYIKEKIVYAEALLFKYILMIYYYEQKDYVKYSKLSMELWNNINELKDYIV